MNVTINGYVSYICNRCKEAYSVDESFLTFHEDIGSESEDDEYIRYISQLETPCVSCAQDIHIALEVWEHPESVANYSYCASESVGALTCEFTIEHYFDDEIAIKERGSDQPEIAVVSEENTDEKVFNETYKEEGYVDHYDHEE